MTPKYIMQYFYNKRRNVAPLYNIFSLLNFNVSLNVKKNKKFKHDPLHNVSHS